MSDSRFQVIQSAAALPGQCGFCGKSEGPFIDLALQFDFYGALISCIPCAQDIGRVSGLVDPQPVAETTLDALAIVKGLPSIIKDFEADLNGCLVRLRNSVNLESPPVLPGAYVPAEPETTNSETSGTSAADDSAFGLEDSVRVSSNSGS